MVDAFSCADLNRSWKSQPSPVTLTSSLSTGLDSLRCLYHHLHHLSRLLTFSPCFQELRKTNWSYTISARNCLPCQNCFCFSKPGVASGFAPGSRVPLIIAMFQMMDVVGRFAPQWSVTGTKYFADMTWLHSKFSKSNQVGNCSEPIGSNFFP